MKLYDPLHSGKASGKHAGGVYSFNRGLATFKKYTIPHQPNSPEQQAIKNRFSYLTKYWKTSLTYEQITLWNEWNLPWTDIYGNIVLLTGINKFCICNDTLHAAGKTITDIPPTETPSELTLQTDAYTDVIATTIDGISNAEITAQTPFLIIDILGDLQSFTYTTGLLKIFATGIPISRTPLEKNYTTVYYYDCRPDLEGLTELTILLQKSDTPPSLQSIRIQRLNKFGFWSAESTYINSIEILNMATNGHFFYDGGWTKGGGWTIHDGKAYIVNGDNLSQTITALEYGNTYQIDFDLVYNSGNSSLWVYVGNNTFGQYDSSGHKTATILFNAGQKSLMFSGAGTINATIDNVILQKL